MAYKSNCSHKVICNKTLHPDVTMSRAFSRLILVIFTLCSTLSSELTLASDTDLLVEVSPRGDVIYKLEEALGSENWVIFVSLTNRSRLRLSLNSITYTILSRRTVVSKIVDAIPVVKLQAGQTYKMPLRFFREQRDRDVDELLIEVTGKNVVGRRQVKLSRFQQKIKLRLPLLGTWMVGSAHDYGVSHRRWDNRAHFAWDFIKVDAEGRTAAKDVENPKNHYAFGEPVVAPADGVVLKIKDGFIDHLVGLDAPDANGIFLDLGDDLVAYFAHLRKGSISIKEGERVKVGQKLAEVGNSGQSTMPHLHFHIQKLDHGARDALKPGIPIPVAISDYDAISKNGSIVRVGVGRPAQGDFVRGSIDKPK